VKKTAWICALTLLALTAFAQDRGATATAPTALVPTAAPAAAPTAPLKVVASNSWTAAFVDLAGIDGAIALAPANLQHPPEYEISAQDIARVASADFMVCAGYERMMKTIADSAGSTRLVKIVTDNNLDNVIKQVSALAQLAHTEAASAPRLAAYKALIEQGRKRVAALGLDKKRALVHVMQVPLAKDLGLNVAGTFGPNPIGAAEIAEAKKGAYDIIIDNVHSPLVAPLKEVLPKAKLVAWRNFPDRLGRGALETTVRANIELILQP
jgi:hypothetical protein